MIAEIRASGITSLQGIADELNRRGVKPPQGKFWGKSSVRNMDRDPGVNEP